MSPKSAPKKILFLINSLAGGGAERVMMTLLEGSRDRFAATPFTLALLDDDSVAYPPPDWLPVVRLSTGSSLLRGLVATRSLVRRYRPDLIVSFLTRANIVAALVGRSEGVPVVISERVNTAAHLAGVKAAASRLLVRLSYRYADHVIAVSQGVADGLANAFGVQRNRLTTIANPVDVAGVRSKAAADTSPPPAEPYIVAVGRLTETKNMSLLVRAYARADMGCRLVILGDGPERNKLTAEITEIGVGDRVSLAGFTANPFAIVRHARTYVSASNAEGFPNALVEAMALGRPVIITNCASGPSEILARCARETITATVTTPYGRLVPTGDLTELSAALRWVEGRSSGELEAMGANCAARAEDFAPALAVSRYWAVFEDTMPREGARISGEADRAFQK